MLTIPDEFWNEEQRSDFWVSEPMKKLWAVQLNLLNTVLDIAHKHGIRVWADYGTLLGAVRHHGYVPWDDDVDLCIMRKDYVNFITILSEELPPQCAVISHYTSNKHNEPKCFIAARKRIDIGNDPSEALITEEYYNCPYATGVDLSPLDFLPQDFETRNYITSLYSAVYGMAQNAEELQASGELSEYLHEIEKALNIKISPDEDIKKTLWKLSDSIASMTNRKDARELTWYPEFVLCGERHRRPISAYSETVMMDFEMIKVPVPAGYDKVLSSEYGENYMKPVRGKTAHDYPVFKNQELKILFHSRLGQIGDLL